MEAGEQEGDAGWFRGRARSCFAEGPWGAARWLLVVGESVFSSFVIERHFENDLVSSYLLG